MFAFRSSAPATLCRRIASATPLVAAQLSACVLVAAASLKILAGSAPWRGGGAVAIAIALFELSLGWWLASGIARGAAMLCAAPTFMLFALYAAFHAFMGQDACGCFGEIAVPPIVMSIIDLFLVALLSVGIFWGGSDRRAEGVSSPLPQTSFSTLVKGVSGLVIVSFAATLAIVGAHVGAGSPTRPPTLAVSEETRDWGTVWVTSDFNWRIDVVNTGATRQVIGDVQPSCSCLFVEPRAFSIPPGGHRSIALRIDLRPRNPQPFSRDARSLKLALRLRDGDGAPMEPLWIEGRVLDLPINAPRQIVLSNDGIGASRVLRRTVGFRADPTIVSISAQTGEPNLKLHCERSDSDSQVFRLHATLSEGGSVGQFSIPATLVLATANGRTLPPWQFEVRGEIESPVRPSESIIALGIMREGDRRIQSITLDSDCAGPLRILGARLSRGAAASVDVASQDLVSYSVSSSPSSTEIRVVFNARNAESVRLRLEFDVAYDPNERVCTIPILLVGEVLPYPPKQPHLTEQVNRNVVSGR